MVIQAPTNSVVECETIVELERLFNKSLLLKHTLGTLLPGIEEEEISSFGRVLEIGCGPGGWALAMAQSFYTTPMHITGIDSSTGAIAYAKIQASVTKQDNVNYHLVHHLSGPFSFLPDASFDLVSAQFLTKSLYSFEWLDLFKECKRVLKPGGKFRLTESDLGLTNAPAHEELVALFIQAMRMSGRSFSPTNRHLGVLCELKPMLRATKFQDIAAFHHMIDYSKGTPLHEEWKRDYLILSKQVLPFLVQCGLATQEYVEMLYLEQKREMNALSFHALLPFLTVWGTN